MFVPQNVRFMSQKLSGYSRNRFKVMPLGARTASAGGKGTAHQNLQEDEEDERGGGRRAGRSQPAEGEHKVSSEDRPRTRKECGILPTTLSTGDGE